MSNQYHKYLKALETLIYVASKEQRSYWALKAIYFADKEHLAKYGRQIFGDSYIAMKHGPVPSLAYDIVKDVQGRNSWIQFDDPVPSSVFSAPDNHTLIPQREADKRYLSKTELLCLDNACTFVSSLSFAQLREKSHDKAYLSVEQDEEIPIEKVVETLENGKEVSDYINAE
jgi:uncharacterized phage-associated protein